MFYVYVLRYETDSGFYVGFSNNLKRRIKANENGVAFATSYRGPRKLIYYEAYLEREDALGRERYLKSGSGRRFLKSQLSQYLKKNSTRNDRVSEAFYADKSGSIKATRNRQKIFVKKDELSSNHR